MELEAVVIPWKADSSDYDRTVSRVESRTKSAADRAVHDVTAGMGRALSDIDGITRRAIGRAREGASAARLELNRIPSKLSSELTVKVLPMPARPPGTYPPNDSGRTGDAGVAAPGGVPARPAGLGAVAGLAAASAGALSLPGRSRCRPRKSSAVDQSRRNSRPSPLFSCRRCRRARPTRSGPMSN